MELAAAAVFVLVAVGTAALGIRVSIWRARTLERLAPRPAAAAPAAASPALAWRELVNRIGSRVPASSKDLPRLKRRLIRAGFRDPAAIRVFQGARAAWAAVFGATAL